MPAVRRFASLGVVAALVAAAPLGAARASAIVPKGYTATFVVDSTGDGSDAAINGVCATSLGDCTLRAALQEANKAAGATLITFAIPGPGTHQIAPATVLPALDNAAGGITIDATTQPGSVVNSDPLADNAVYGIELEGQGPTGINGFNVLSADNVIQGLDLHGFKVDIDLYGSSAIGNQVLGDLVGLLPNGALDPTQKLYAPSSCVVMQQGASNNVIGAPGSNNRNVVSGCNHIGIATYDYGTKNNVIQNNITGLDPAGTQRRPNISHGIDVNTGTQYTMIGGTGFQERNLVSGNGQDGVEVSHNALTQHNSVIGNFIGTGLTGNGAPAYAVNGQWGVHLEGAPGCGTAACPLDAGYQTVTDNVIVESQKGGLLVDKGVHDCVIARNRIGLTLSGTPAGNKVFGIEIAAGSVRNTIGPGNEIAYNQGGGVQIRPDSIEPASAVQSPTNQNTITQNSIHDNVVGTTAALGIDLFPLGAVNTASTANANTNEGTLGPVLSNVTTTTVDVRGCPFCWVEVFIADRPAASYGAGKTFLVRGEVAGNGVVRLTLPASARHLPITADVTNTHGSTSEFAKNVLVP
jgi:CSLREA domain-containing protein